MSALWQVRLIIAGALIGAILGMVVLAPGGDLRPVALAATVGLLLFGLSFATKWLSWKPTSPIAGVRSTRLGQLVLTFAGVAAIALAFSVLLRSDARPTPARQGNALATFSPSSAPAVQVPVATAPASDAPSSSTPASTPSQGSSAVPPGEPAQPSPVPRSSPAAPSAGALSSAPPRSTPAPPPSAQPSPPDAIATTSPGQTIAPLSPQPTPTPTSTPIIPVLPPLPTLPIPTPALP